MGLYCYLLTLNPEEWVFTDTTWQGFRCLPCWQGEKCQVEVGGAAIS